MSDPVAVLGKLQDLASRLDVASKSIYTMDEKLAGIEVDYDDTRNDILVKLIAEYERSDTRLPGEDVRNALVTNRLREQEPDLYKSVRNLRAKISRYERRARRIEREIDAQRSVLSFLKTEVEATS